MKRFWDKVDVTEYCWTWVGYTRPDKYGRMWYKSKSWLSHRVAWELFMGPIPKNIHVLHSCDNPNCVNPAHLWLGTHVDNMQDKIKKGRDHNQKKTRCPKGHEYSIKNTRFSKKGGRICITCYREYDRIWKKEKRNNART